MLSACNPLCYLLLKFKVPLTLVKGVALLRLSTSVIVADDQFNPSPVVSVIDSFFGSATDLQLGEPVVNLK
ncbi:hypothetical protein L917_16319 [Phytophthora nicotianae]|uniref:Uncharacterized protein n=1 Tax=Phytophthora nicotianae TaxID=4792 RepID=W2KFB1_PHYNI|nr:hypothetical protein L917_16319 [Phytophthora nicotianae]